MFHKEILNGKQVELLPLVGEFKREYSDLLDLAAMKAYALGRRSKWKDYVDLYFLYLVIGAKLSKINVWRVKD